MHILSITVRTDAHPVDYRADNTAANLGRVIERGLMLAENLRGLGVPVEHEVRTLRSIAAEFGSPGENVSRERLVGLYLGARWAVRRMALRNPLLDFDAVLFAKAAPTRFPHISDQYYGWWSRPGGGIFVLEGFRGDKPRLRCLTSGWAVGSYHRPDLSYDGKKVIFAYCRYHAHVPEIKNKADKSNVPEDAFYHIFEMNIDGTGVSQLTRGRYDDFDARYLPSGEIVFLSTRKGVALQCGKASAAAT
ncbi:MAG: TolB-like translocation protein, partial [Planctomycetota bacterium]